MTDTTEFSESTQDTINKWRDTPVKDRDAPVKDRDKPIHITTEQRVRLLEFATIKHENAIEAICEYLGIQLQPCSALKAVKCDAKKEGKR